jgi:hypothetical protein
MKKFILPILTMASIFIVAVSCEKEENTSVAPNSNSNSSGNSNIDKPMILSDSVKSITGTSAICGGVILSDGGSNITSRGVCWDTVPNPTVSGNYLASAAGTGAFSVKITGLKPFKVYYVRPYATNGSGTFYGMQHTFSTYLPLGSSYGGGIVYYILQPNDPGYKLGEYHGLIVTENDLGNVPWGCQGAIVSGADGTGIGSGKQNTIDIINGCAEAGTAARLCDDLVLNGYSDWYLPSSDECQKINLGGYCVSSTEIDLNYARSFNYGSPKISLKNDPVRVRAIRSF